MYVTSTDLERPAQVAFDGTAGAPQSLPPRSAVAVPAAARQ